MNATAEKLFRVNEFSSGFEVEHIPTGKTHWMSDGVDALFGLQERFKWERDGQNIEVSVLVVNGNVIIRQVENDEPKDLFAMDRMPIHLFGEIADWMEDADETALSPGDPDFRQAWEDALNSDAMTTCEAYFPEEYDG